MDHLQLDDAFQLQPVIIPVYGDIEYDGGNFETYLDRLNLDESDLLSHSVESSELGSDHRDMSPEMVCSVLQEWLFFGLLMQFGRVFELKLSRTTFLIIEESGVKRVDTSKLFALAETVIRRQYDLKMLSINAINGGTNDAEVEDEASKSSENGSDKESDEEESMTSRLIDEGVEDGQADDKQLLEDDPPLILEELKPARLDAKDLEERVRILRDTPIDMEDERVATEGNRVLVIAMKFLDKLYEFAEKIGNEVWSRHWWMSARTVTEMLGKIIDLVSKTRDIRPHPTFFEDYFILRTDATGRCYPLMRWLSMTDFYLTSSLIARGGGDHSRCPYLGICGATSALPDQIPLHNDSCLESCVDVSLDDNALLGLERCLESGSFGILKIRGGALEGWRLELVPKSDVGETFVALSHVWSHGMGNPVANALPACQLQLIADLLQRCPKPTMYFWMDTLCVPLTNPYRRIAISRMRDVYSEANCVLVIDRDLLQTGNNLIERRVRLVYCDWMQRLWTLQEALLAGDQLCFAFEDDIKSINELMAESDLYRVEILDVGGLWDIEDMFSIKAEPKNLLKLARNMHRRKTTKIEDEPYCLATLINVDILSLPLQPLLSDVFAALDFLPADLIFTPGPRSERPGFRWSPLSFLSQLWHAYYAYQKPGVLTKSGFRVRKPGFLMFQSFAPVQVRADEQECYPILFYDQIRKTRIGVASQYAAQEIRSLLSGRVIHEAALVLELHCDEREAVSGWTKPMDPATTAYKVGVILLSNVREVDGVFHAHYELQFIIHGMLSPDIGPLESATSIPGRFLTLADWCID